EPLGPENAAVRLANVLAIEPPDCPALRARLSVAPKSSRRGSLWVVVAGVAQITPATLAGVADEHRVVAPPIHSRTSNCSYPRGTNRNRRGHVPRLRRSGTPIATNDAQTHPASAISSTNLSRCMGLGRLELDQSGPVLLARRALAPCCATRTLV